MRPCLTVGRLCVTIFAMNAYDFDDTIYRGNSFRRFFGYCLLRLPYLLLYLPVIVLAVLLRAVRLLDKNKYLTWLGAFIVFVPHVERYVCGFWDKELCRIKPWYIAAKRPDDVVVSASPAYLIDEACKRLGVVSVATRTNPRNGKIDGVHCYGAAKVKRFAEIYPKVTPEAYYSDSWSDEPMFAFCKAGFLVKGDKITQVYVDGGKIVGAI